MYCVVFKQKIKVLDFHIVLLPSKQQIQCVENKRKHIKKTTLKINIEK